MKIPVCFVIVFIGLKAVLNYNFIYPQNDPLDLSRIVQCDSIVDFNWYFDSYNFVRVVIFSIPGSSAKLTTFLLYFSQ